MKWKIDFHSIKFKMWGYFILFAALILIVLWLLQTVFLSSYYQNMKTRAIIETAQKIITEYGKEDFENTLQQYSYKSNMVVLITTTDDLILYSSDMFGGMNSTGQFQGGRGMLTAANVLTMKAKILDSEYGEAYYKVPYKQMNSDFLLYGALLQDSSENYILLYIASPLDPIDSTIAILKDQLVIVTIILLLLALVLAFFISKRLAKPIEKLTSSARELASGNYDVIFARGNYSEIAELAGTLNYATRELSKTDSLRKELIANVSHDLRTPLTMIKMYAEMVRDLSGNNPAKRNAHLNIIIDETDRLSVLVNDILDLSKIEAGTVQMPSAPINISETVRRMLTRFEILVQKGEYSFHLECENSLFVTGNEMRLEQVIYNLISNAVNYTGDDKQVFVRLFRKDGKVRFEVTDTGKGIPPEKLANIWERYYRSEETHKRAIVGTGLGLSIVRNILTVHQAAYGADSIVDQGSTFWFELDELTDDKK